MSVAGRLKELHPRRFFLETWRAMDAEAEEERQARRDAGLPYDYRPLIAFCSGALFLTLMEYVGVPRVLHQVVGWLIDLELDGTLAGTFFQDWRGGPWWELSNHTYWAIWRVLGFLVFPMITIRLSGHRIRDQNLSTKGFWEHLWIYLLAFAVVLVAVVVVSFTEGFSSYYPFYKSSERSWFDFLFWEFFYILQFLSLEFFFRGWWLRAGKTLMGSTAIFAMVVPYVMIHFGKEFPETVAAIFAGVFLGTLSMRTRSIWGGFLVHCLVAVAMDIAALLQTEGLPTRWWPEF
ncbi:MAG: CPBP family intramembrane glutamic endopeptidase [Myxococcota bacterium]